MAKEKKPIILTQKQIEEKMKNSVTDEGKICEKYGWDEAKKRINAITKFKKDVTLSKLGEDVCLIFSKQRESAKTRSTFCIDAFSKEGKHIGNLKYDLQGLHCANLFVIEVLDEKFIDQGLGSLLIEEFESVAKSFDIKRSSAKVAPFGKFANRTYQFYKNNGYDLNYDPSDRACYAEKNLEQNNLDKTQNIEDTKKPEPDNNQTERQM